MSNESTPREIGFADRTHSARRAVDWILAVLLILFGLAATALGGVLVGAADRSWFEELVEEENVRSDVISEAELVDAMFAGTWWGGLGVVVVGLGMVIGGVLFAIGRRKIDRLEAGSDAPTFVANALLGAAITVLVSFIPFSGLLGGGVAGYLETADSWSGAIVGLASGAILSAPIAAIAIAVAIGLAAEGLAVWGLALLVGMLFAIAFAIAIPAIGGALGSYLRDRESTD